MRNPVEAGLCATPEAWPWSSHVALADGHDAALARRAATLSYFEPVGGDPRQRYLEFVAATADESKGV